MTQRPLVGAPGGAERSTFERGPFEDDKDSYVGVQLHFIGPLLVGTRAVTRAEDNCETLAVALSACTSAERGSVVVLSEFKGRH